MCADSWEERGRSLFGLKLEGMCGGVVPEGKGRRVVSVTGAAASGTVFRTSSSRFMRAV